MAAESFTITYTPAHADRRHRVCFQKCRARDGYIRATEVEEADGVWRRTGAEYVADVTISDADPADPPAEHPSRECPRARGGDD